MVTHLILAAAGGTSGTTTAIIAVVGTVAGAAIGGGASLLKDLIEDRRTSKAAVLLVAADLAIMKQVVDDALAQSKWPPGQAGHNWAASWVTYSGSLARAVDRETFAAVAVALGRVPALLSGLAAGERPFLEPQDGVSESPDRIFLEAVHEDLVSAIAAIDRVSG